MDVRAMTPLEIVRRVIVRLEQRAERMTLGWRDESMAEVAALRAVLADAERLREMLAVAYAGALLYRDDGELQDNRAVPFIDFRRDPVDDIRGKMTCRAIDAASKPPGEARCATNLTQDQYDALVRDAMAYRSSLIGRKDPTPRDSSKDAIAPREQPEPRFGPLSLCPHGVPWREVCRECD